MPKPLPRAEEYTYELPDGYSMDKELRAKLDALVNKTALSENEAREFVALHIELMEDYADRLQTANKSAEYSPENPTI